MTIAPPGESFRRDPHLRDPAAAARIKAKNEAYLRSPEGQAAEQAELEATKRSHAMLRDLYIKNGWMDEDGNFVGSDKTSRVEALKTVAQKITGLFSGWATKIKKNSR